MLELLIVVLLILWLTGSFVIGGNAVHILLVLVLVLIVYRLATGRNAL